MDKQFIKRKYKGLRDFGGKNLQKTVDNGKDNRLKKTRKNQKVCG